MTGEVAESRNYFGARVGAKGARGLWLVLIAGLAFLGAAAAYVMRKREFHV